MTIGMKISSHFSNTTSYSPGEFADPQSIRYLNKSFSRAALTGRNWFFSSEWLGASHAIQNRIVTTGG
ncbi:uncharacterized protein PHALS_05047 [Plasmopara halstedii]|uniref:Uncharacterized protein n=1 Tax=Plasmopara halstedii TaxID=4781 RepID=A0A0P1AAB2_PLAHL|nr:uncharacterized protein PHALS_05047 [Plasmopara halstedii]CEG37454.1 hypothetical protein PHALS_05047 [Plasmopara halstedii]|eukprot:XP_024573823.1 hypothetical protein PHALS_05047 [Plasmopara halstedii]